MDKGIFTALSGAMSQNQKLDVISNNIANVDTVGFKKDESVFKEYVTALEKQESVINVPRVEFKPSDFYHLQGNDKSYVSLDDVVTNHEAGRVKRTGNTLDLALNGDGFFEVSTPIGLRYTRAGNFSVNSLGKLVTEDGFPVLAKPTPQLINPEQREIKLNSSNIEITPDGSIFGNGQVLNKFNLVEFKDRAVLNKAGRNLFVARENAPVNLNSKTAVLQGYIEGSNVNAVSEMIDLISTTRVFDGLNNAIRAYSDMASKGTNVLADMNQ